MKLGCIRIPESDPPSPGFITYRISTLVEILQIVKPEAAKVPSSLAALLGLAGWPGGSADFGGALGPKDAPYGRMLPGFVRIDASVIMILFGVDCFSSLTDILHDHRRSHHPYDLMSRRFVYTHTLAQ